MFNSRELEGEVDHSFFDSDCDSANLSKDAGHRMEKCLKGGKDNPVAQGKLKEKSQNTKGEASPRSDGATVQLAPDKSNSDNRAEENSGQSTDEERGRASSVSCDVSGSDTVTSDRSESDQDTNIYSRKPNGKMKSLLVGDEEVDSETMCQQSPNNSEEDVSSSAKHPGSKGRNKQSPKRRIRNRRIRSPSSSSTEASVDADSESSCSSVTNRSSSGLPSLPRPNKSSLSPGVRGTQIGSAGPRNVLVDPTEKAEDTVTDVSPLSSSDFSPQQSLEPYLEEATEGALTQHQQQKEGSVPSSGLSPTQPDEDSDQDDDCSLSSESQFEGRTVFVHPGGRHRKNYSFTNDQVRRIDQENQRLLRELSRLSPGPRPASTAGKKTHTATNSLPIRLSHSALNRQREQQRIERENLAFLKRLESVKPSPGLKRSQQLADYQQQISYLRGPSYPVFLSTTKRERSTTKTPSAGPRPVSSVHRSPRPVSTSTDSRNTPRSKKPSAARPAWC